MEALFNIAFLIVITISTKAIDIRKHRTRDTQLALDHYSV